jgi:division protein CdvB (Snf7/Vps24/ESCRT-III family)
MAKMNKVMNPAQMSRVTQQFTQEHTKLGIKGEMSMY